MVLTIEEEDRYVFVFDVDDPDSPTIGVFKEAYWGDTDVYVRGGMNGWGAVDRFSYQGTVFILLNWSLVPEALNSKLLQKIGRLLI